MSNTKGVSMAVVRRLPKYHRYLFDLMQNDVDRISSMELSEKISFTASQIRQDLNNFGDFGQQGYGYNVRDLYTQIGNILGLNTIYKTVIVGAGNLGQAIANYFNFEKHVFELLALFDLNPRLIGLEIRGVEIMDIDKLESFVINNKVDIGIITTPKIQAQRVADILVKSQIKAIWNFAPTDIKVPKDVVVEDVHLSESLFTLAYKMNEKKLHYSIDRG